MLKIDDVIIIFNFKMIELHNKRHYNLQAKLQPIRKKHI